MSGRKILRMSVQTFRSGILLPALLAAAIFIVPSCKEDIGDTYYTFTGETVGGYITNRPESFSEFNELLDRSGVLGLLNSYGEYTCFLPDNQAMINYYHSKGKNSLDDFSADSLKQIAYDHIIKGFEITTDDFEDGLLPNLTMSGRFLNVSLQAGETSIIYRINITSTIETRDIEKHNGVIHVIDKTLSPTQNTLVEAIANNSKYSLFFEALMATGLYSELELIKDESYDPELIIDNDGVINGIGGINRVPKERKYGYTAFIESNETYAANGITNLEEMKTYAKTVYDEMYTEDAGITDITDRKNSLNRFVAYHLVNKKLTSKLILEAYDKTGQYYESRGETHSIQIHDMLEYIETMCPNTLIEVRTLRTTNEYNIFNMIGENGTAIRMTDDFDNDAINGVYHEIDNILAYTQDVERMLSTKRLRMDAASFFPELTNNNIRVGHASPFYPSEEWFFTDDYIDRVKTSETTQFEYINADDRFCDYQGDEVFLSGLYDFEITTLPIPPGTYEVRFGYQPTLFRGVAQLYWDGVPTGIPLNLSLYADNPKIGHVIPGIDPADPYGYENDKMMRNRGYMKAPASFRAINPVWYTGDPARSDPAALRRILGIYTFPKATTHKFAVKAVKTGQFMFDYLEFVPLEVLEFEDVY